MQLFFARKARGCGQHPVFPAPSLISEGHCFSKTRTMHVARTLSQCFSAVGPANAGSITTGWSYAAKRLPTEPIDRFRGMGPRGDDSFGYSPPAITCRSRA